MAWHILSDRCLVKVSGPDASAFLQNLVTNDMNLFAGGARIIYACMLTPQGRFLHDFFISGNSADGFFLECETCRRDDLIRRLNIFRLRAKVKIEDCYGLFDAYYSAEPPEGVIYFKDPRLAAIGCRFYLPCGKKSPDVVSTEKYRDIRINLGVPEGSREIKPETDILANVNLDYLNAVSWNKGCYVGQEITAMTENRGTVKKRMAIISGARLQAGDTLRHNGHAVGEIRVVDSSGGQGLAILKLAVFNDSSCPVTTTDGITVSVQLPEWLKLENA